VTLPVREWLPVDALDHEVVRDGVRDAITRWSALWFPAPWAEMAGMRAAAADSRHDGDGSGWRVYRQAIAVRASRPVLSRMLLRVLDLRAEPASLTEADRLVMDGLEGKILASLAETVETALGVSGTLRSEPARPADPLDGGGLVVSLAEPAGRDMLYLAIPKDLVFRHVRRTIPRSPGRTPVFPPLGEALAAVNIPIEAQIGKVELTLGEFNELAVGDVLVLDRRLDEAVDIAGLRSRDVFARAVLTNIEDGLALVFNA